MAAVFAQKGGTRMGRQAQMRAVVGSTNDQIVVST